jgi:hypothetical protein
MTDPVSGELLDQQQEQQRQVERCHRQEQNAILAARLMRQLSDHHKTELRLVGYLLKISAILAEGDEGSYHIVRAWYRHLDIEDFLGK